MIFGLPILTYSVIILWLVFMLPYDSPKFLIAQGKRQEALKSIHKVYKTDGHPREALRIYYKIKQNSSDETSRVSFTQAFFTDERYTRASLVGVMVVIFSELTGF